MRMTLLPVSRRKQECPYQMIFMRNRLPCAVRRPAMECGGRFGGGV